MKVYARFDLSLHGLQLKSEDEMDKVIAAIVDAVRAVHPTLRADSDVELELVETAGEYEP